MAQEGAHESPEGTYLTPLNLPSTYFSSFSLLVCLTNMQGGDGGGLVAKSCPTLVIPWTVAHQAPLSMGFSRPEYWSGLPFPSPGDPPDPGMQGMQGTGS